MRGSHASRAAAGARITVTVQLIRFGVQTAGLVILSRLLTPTDFGLVALVTAVLGVADVLRDLGLSSAAVQARELSPAQASNLFWLNVGFGTVLAAIAIAAAPVIASVGGDQRLQGVTIALSSVILMNAVQAQFQANMLRDQRFGAVAATDAVSSFLGLAAGIVAALAGAGIWALVAQNVMQGLTLAAQRIAISHFRPGLPRRGVEMNGLVRFGANLAGTQLLVYLSANIDAIIMGARYGPLQLGLYKRASQLVSMPLVQVMSPLTSVALPSLARYQEDRETFWAYFRKAQAAASYPLALGLAFLAINSDWVIRLIFGPGWEGAVPMLRILAIGSIIQVSTYPAYWGFLALGRTDSHLRLSLLTRAILILCIWLGALVSPEGVAFGYVAGVLIGFPLSYSWLAATVSVAPRRLLGVPSRIVVVSLASAASGLAVAAVAGASPIWSGLAGSAAGLVALGAAWLVAPTVRQELAFTARQLTAWVVRRADPPKEA